MGYRQGYVKAATLVVLVLSMPSGVQAQISPQDVIDPGPRSEEVESATALQRVRDEVIYLRPEADFKPDEDVRVEVPEPPKSSQDQSTESRWANGIIFGLILALIIFLFVRYGNAIQVSFGDRSDKRRGDSDDDTSDGIRVEALPNEGLLDHLRGIADRREALILLTGQALERAASQNGLKLARAQTARDIVRVVPRQWGHLEALRRLVRETEIVYFGGRDLSEETWNECLALAGPIFNQRARA